jgi:hypothetical protein
MLVISNVHVFMIFLLNAGIVPTVNKLAFDIKSVVFHFDDFNYGRRITTIFFLTIATQLFFK